MHVLVVDDDELILETLSLILTREGASVSTAYDGVSALAAVTAAVTPYTLIFVDLQMPGRDGIQLLRDFASLGLQSSIALISGHGSDIVHAAEATARAHGLHVAGRLTKPLDREQLRLILAVAQRVPSGPSNAIQPFNISTSDIRTGIADQQFYIAYQAKADANTAKVTGAECLARWKHPELGNVPPSVFIPIAERSEIIDELTDYIFSKAMEDLAVIHRSWPAFTLSVNISTRSMSRLDLPDRFAAAMQKAGHHPSKIILEVTETRVAENIADFMETASRLRLKGFHLSIDDFGTGFSTMEQVGRLPVNELKIDREFVAGAPDDLRKMEILKASIGLGRSLDLACVCEGVETSAEWDLVRKLGATSVQGYFLAKPMTLAVFMDWCGARPAT